MHVRDLLIEIAERGITLTCGRTEDCLNAKPTSALTPELIVEIKEHKQEIIQILRKDDEFKRNGRIQSERQIFDLAREFFGPSCPFDPSKHPPSKRELWVDEDKEAFFFPHRYPGGGGE
jgi:hypothetical protein